MSREVMTEVLGKIKEYNKIILFRHIRPDGDCVGATNGLRALILATFPEKEVYIADWQKCDYLAFLNDAAGEIEELNVAGLFILRQMGPLDLDEVRADIHHKRSLDDVSVAS